MDKEQKPANQPVSAFDLFPKSAQIVQNNLTPFLILNLIPFLSSLGYLRGGSRIDNSSNRFSGIGSISGLPGYALGAFVGFGIILFLLVIAVSLIVSAMKYGLQFESAKGKKPGLEQLWPYAKKYWLRLFGLLIVTAIFVFFGFILLIIPGLIAIRRYFLAPYLMLDKDLSIKEAMKQSAALSKQHSGAVWGVIGVMFLISLPSVIPFIGWVISFILTLLYSVAPALRYQELKKLQAS
jgi:uncharacterized membrane protein